MRRLNLPVFRGFCYGYFILESVSTRLSKRGVVGVSKISDISVAYDYIVARLCIELDNYGRLSRE